MAIPLPLPPGCSHPVVSPIATASGLSNGRRTRADQPYIIPHGTAAAGLGRDRAMTAISCHRGVTDNSALHAPDAAATPTLSAVCPANRSSSWQCPLHALFLCAFNTHHLVSLSASPWHHLFAGASGCLALLPTCTYVSACHTSKEVALRARAGSQRGGGCGLRPTSMTL
jgi:hypothetical protein